MHRKNNHSKKVIEILDNATKRLSIPKSRMNGVKLTYTGAQKFPNAYKYIPDSTHFTAVHNGSYWKIIEIERSLCPNRVSNTFIFLTEDAQNALIDSVTVCELH